MHTYPFTKCFKLTDNSSKYLVKGTFTISIFEKKKLSLIEDTDLLSHMLAYWSA